MILKKADAHHPDQLLTNFAAKTYDILHEVMIPPKSQKMLEACVFPAFYRVHRHAPPFRKLSATVLLHVGSRLSPHTRSKKEPSESKLSLVPFFTRAWLVTNASISSVLQIIQAVQPPQRQSPLPSSQDLHLSRNG